MATVLNDTKHPVRFLSDPKKKIDMVVQSMTGNEHMGRLFEFHLELLSFNSELHFDKIVGELVTVVMDLSKGERYFSGYITEFQYMGNKDGFARYHATLRPWLWFLTRTSDCRIFQDKTVPEIIEKVFEDCGVAKYEVRYNPPLKYRKIEFCVQYRESDFNFISRLMEQEGIYYFFEHAADKHTLVLTDDASKQKAFPGFERVPYYPPTQMKVETRDHLDNWAVTQSITSEGYAVRDFNFEKKNVEIMESKSFLKGSHAYPLKNPEIFDYPGEYSLPKEGDLYANVRLQELKCQHERVQSGGNCRGMCAGSLFTLTDFTRLDQNREYQVISVSHQINAPSYISGGSSGDLYSCQVEVMKKEIPFRPARSTPKPIVQGPQTAIVVGGPKDEISTDKYGRVKVQFHWDRKGENNLCFDV